MQTQLPRRPYVELPPPPDGLASARRAGVRRRTRRTVAAFTGAVGALAVVAVVILMLGGGGGVAMLRPAPAPPAAHVPSPSVSKAPPVVPGRAGGPASSGPAQQTVGSRPLTTASPKSSSSTSSSQSSPRRGQVVLVRSQSRYTGAPRVCRSGFESDGQTIEPGDNWCLDATAARTKDGERLSLSLCRDSTSSGALTFASTREVDFAVTQGGKTVWSWSHDNPGVPSQHSLSAAADGCWVWSLVWPGITQSGRAAGHGSYALVATTTAEEMKRDGSRQVGFSF